MFSNIIKTILVVVGVRGSQFREANDEIYPVAGMVLRSRRQNTLLQRLSSGVIIFECLVRLLNVSSGCQIVKLCQSFYLSCRECPWRSFLVVELAIYKSFVEELFFCCVLCFMSSEVSTVTFCKSSDHIRNFNSWWVVFGLILSYSLLACLVFVSPLPACLVVTLLVQRSTG